MLETLLGQLQNQFVGGGLVLMMAGAIMALAKSLPFRFWRFLKRRLTVDVEVMNSDPLFGYVCEWIDSQPYSKRSRSLTAITKKNSQDYDESLKEKPRIILSPAPGTHWIFHKGRLIKIYRHREEGGSNSPASSNLKKVESWHFTVLGRKQDCIRQLLQEIVDFATKPTDRINVYTSIIDYWHHKGDFKPRGLETVVLPDGQAEAVLADAKKFIESEEWYRSLGIPWHRGYLLYGLPGTGKTSLVSAIAGELRKDLYILNIGVTGMNDDRLNTLISRVDSGSIIVMEDVDCTFPDREVKEKGVSLSGLLNCLDGLQSREGCMIFMTTNNVEALDAAITRPGRADYKMEFREATVSQILRLRDRISPSIPDSVVLEKCSGKTMAYVQEFLIKEL